MATGIYLSPEGLGDLTEVQTLEYPVTDAEKVQELLLSSPLFYSISPTEAMIPNQASSENSPPPRAAFAILDRPFPEPGAELTLDSVTTQQCVAALFGKETDREARLVIVDAVANERTALEDRLKDVLGELIQEPQNIRTLGKVSQTQLMIHHRYSYPRDREMDFEAIKKFEDEYFAVHFPDRWSTLPLGFLEGKTPADAAKDPAYQVRLLAAIQFFAFWLSEDVALEISNKIRSRFGLPTLDSIPVPDASEGTEIELLGVLDEQPIWRWSRFEVEKLPTAVLIEGLQIVAVMKEMMATKRFAEELLGRPMKSMPVESRAVAFNSLISITSGAMQAEDALLWVERAKNEAAELGITDAGWCLHEIPIRLSLKQYDKVQEVVGYLVQNFGHDPKVMQGLQRLFMEMGLINPDGTLVEKFVKEPTSAPQPSLWTPDGGTADMTVTGSLPSNSAAPSKLWTPD